MPYNMLLHKGTRDSLGLRLEDSVVLIDEGHNLLDAISSIHTVEITGAKVSGLVYVGCSTSASTPCVLDCTHAWAA